MLRRTNTFLFAASPTCLRLGRPAAKQSKKSSPAATPSPPAPVTSAGRRIAPHIKYESAANEDDEDDIPKIRVGVLQPHNEGTWSVDDIRCSPDLFSSAKQHRELSYDAFTIRKNSAFKQLRTITSAGKCDVFWNLCDGARDEVRTGEDTVRILESLNVPFTGADSQGFEPSKIEMKMLLAAAGIKTPNFAVLDRSDVGVSGGPDNTGDSGGVEGAAGGGGSGGGVGDDATCGSSSEDASGRSSGSGRAAGKGKKKGSSNKNSGSSSSSNDSRQPPSSSDSSSSNSSSNLLNDPSNQGIIKACSHLRFPVIVKHISGYGSVGITKDSKCETLQQLVKKVKRFVKEYDVALVEEFIVGEEGTVFVCGDQNSPTGCHVFPPLMIPVPGGAKEFLYFDKKWKDLKKLEEEAEANNDGKTVFSKKTKKSSSTNGNKPDASSSSPANVAGGNSSSSATATTTSTAASSSYAAEDEFGDTGGYHFLERGKPLTEKIEKMAANAFIHIMQRVGYGRCDFRIDEVTKEPYFLEINPNCGIFLPYEKTGKYEPGYGDFSDVMIERDWGHDKFIKSQIDIAIKQQHARVPWWNHTYSASAGNFVTKCAKSVPRLTRVFGDDVRPIPVVARTLFDATLKYKVADDVTKIGCAIFRADTNIQNCVMLQHSCQPNCALVHSNTLELATVRSVHRGEMLTIDYATLRDSEMPDFRCSCGSESCRGIVKAQSPKIRGERAPMANVSGSSSSSSSSPSGSSSSSSSSSSQLSSSSGMGGSGSGRSSGQNGKQMNKSPKAPRSSMKVSTGGEEEVIVVVQAPDSHHHHQPQQQQQQQQQLEQVAARKLLKKKKFILRQQKQLQQMRELQQQQQQHQQQQQQGQQQQEQQQQVVPASTTPNKMQ